MGEGLDGLTGIIIEVLRFKENVIRLFEPEGVKLGLLPVEMLELGIKIEQEKAKIVTSEVIFRTRITKPYNEFHENIIAYGGGGCVGWLKIGRMLDF